MIKTTMVQEMQMCPHCSPGFSRTGILAHKLGLHVFVRWCEFTSNTGEVRGFWNESVGNEGYIAERRAAPNNKERKL